MPRMTAPRPQRTPRATACPGMVAAALSLLLVASPARGQTSGGRLGPVAEARWRALLQQAFSQSNQGEHAIALQLAEEAAATRMTPGVRLFLAEEHDALSHGEGASEHLIVAERFALECLEEAAAQRALEIGRAHV